VTTVVNGCNKPVFNEKLVVVKLAIETDSPILHSIDEAEPPPLFRANGVIDWEYNLGVKQKENNKKKYQIVR
jgi:hypothetical protein